MQALDKTGKHDGAEAQTMNKTGRGATRPDASARNGVRLIGEPTGGNRRGINGGAYFFLRLPGTGMEVDLPLIGYFPLRPQPDAGVVPDLLVPVRRSDIASGFDRAMASARKALT